MNETYIYGYRGFEKNNYVDELTEMLTDLNLQTQKINDINQNREHIISEYSKEPEKKEEIQPPRLREIPEEQIKEWYKQDNISMTFDEYRRLILEKNELENKSKLDEYEKLRRQQELEEQKKLENKLPLEVLLERNRDEYFANLKILIEIKQELKKDLNTKKREFEYKIEECNIKISKLQLEMSKIKPIIDEEGNIVNKNEFQRLRKEYDEIEFERAKLKQALGKINEIFEQIEYTKEESDLMLRGLNPQQKKIYEKIKLEESMEYTTDYQKRLEEYNKLLDIYEEDYEKFVEMQEKLDKNEISFEEYNKYVDYMLGRYKLLEDEYNKIQKQYEKTKEEVNNGKKWHPSLTEEQLKELRNQGINKPQGLRYEETLKKLGYDKENIISPVAPTKLSGYGKQKEEDILKIDKKEHKPKLTWKTAAAVAAGIGIGATVFFTAGPMGVMIMNVVAALLKKKISKERKKARAKRLNGVKEVEKVEIPDGKIKAAIFKLKQYLKSEEGLRDMSWLLTSAIITGTSLTIIDGISNAMEAAKTEPTTGEVSTNVESTTSVEPNAPEISTTPEPVQVADAPQSIGVGDGIEGMNITEGYDTANWAINNTNAENLLTQYGDGATIKEFVTSTGEHFTSGTLQDIMTKTGLDSTDIAARLITKGGGEYAWVGADQLGTVVDTVGKVL